MHQDLQLHSTGHTDTRRTTRAQQEAPVLPRCYLVSIHFSFHKLGSPELQRLLQREADPLEEEPVLHAAAVAQVVVLSEALVQLPHAEREGFS